MNYEKMWKDLKNELERRRILEFAQCESILQMMLFLELNDSDKQEMPSETDHNLT